MNTSEPMQPHPEARPLAPSGVPVHATDAEWQRLDDDSLVDLATRIECELLHRGVTPASLAPPVPGEGRGARTPGLSPQVLEVIYTNWKGETEPRRIVPSEVWFGSTEYHPDPQWLLDAVDVDRGEGRTFALRDMLRAAPPVSPEPRAGESPDCRDEELDALRARDFRRVNDPRPRTPDPEEPR